VPVGPNGGVVVKNSNGQRWQWGLVFAVAYLVSAGVFILLATLSGRPFQWVLAAVLIVLAMLYGGQALTQRRRTGR
jgi:hypothetical protein